MSMHQQMRKQLNGQKGFTLIEIAIVLVIIGLLLGGVLKGQELINTARVRALNNSVDGITAAWFSFQDRYRAFPGDYLAARATVNLPGATAERCCFLPSLNTSRIPSEALYDIAY